MTNYTKKLINKNEKLKDYFNYMVEQEYSENTIDQYFASLNQYFERYNELTKENLLDYKRTLIEEGTKPKTVNVRLLGVTQYGKFLGLDISVKQLKIQHEIFLSNVISEGDYNKVLDGLKNDNDLKNYFFIKALASTGCRVSEFVRLETKCLEKGYQDMHSKGKERRIFISEKFIEESKGFYSKNSDMIYLAENKFHKQLTTRGVHYKLQQIGKKYGVPKEVMHPHGFRHFFAKQALKSTNNDLYFVSSLLGHSSIETTAIYLRMSEDEFKKKFESVNW